MRLALPSISVDVGFQDYNLLTQAPGTATSQDRPCVPVQVTGNGAQLDASLCKLNRASSMTPSAPPALRLVLGNQQTLYGMRDAILAPATPDSAVAEAYLAALAAEGLPVPRYVPVRLAVNGADWGPYTLEERVEVAAVSALVGRPVDLVVAFELPEPEPPDALAGGFRQAQMVAWRLPDTARQDAPTRSSEAAFARAEATVRALLTDRIAPSEVFDVQMVAEYLALTALWRGVLAPDWRCVLLAYTHDSAAFWPIGRAGPHDAHRPVPPQMLDDAVLQRAYVRALARYADEGYIEEALASGDLAAKYAALGGDAWSVSRLRSVLEANRTTIRAYLEPHTTLHAWIEDEDGYLRLRLEAIHPYPVEIIALDQGGHGAVEIARPWVTEEVAGLGLVATSEPVLRARVSDAPVSAIIRVPLTALPQTASEVGSDIAIVTRVWGLEDTVTVPVTGLGRVDDY